ncbi:MAG: lysophospholipase [Chloroflexi bacterium]|nr:MAG: lysophospholipase [Chloroflexota bacterium]
MDLRGRARAWRAQWPLSAPGCLVHAAGSHGLRHGSARPRAERWPARPRSRAEPLKHADHIDRAIFSAPLLMVKQRVPAWKRALSTILPRVAPGMSFSNEVDANLLSHDPANAPAYTSDPLVHDHITAGLYGDTIARGEEFITRAPELRVPFLLMQGRDDRVVDPLGAQRFFARAVAPDRAFCLYPGLYHEIFNELDHEKVFQDIESWLTQRTNGHLTGWNPPP